MIGWSQYPAVERIPEKVRGVWLFKNTRVPVKALFENLEGGATVNEVLEWFPGVEGAQVAAMLEHAQRSLEADGRDSVRILFDQGTPVPSRRALVDHEVATAFERGWHTLRNGELLQAAESAGFAALVPGKYVELPFPAM
jgi:uncharacterized protein (DUF433 family)